MGILSNILLKSNVQVIKERRQIDDNEFLRCLADKQSLEVIRRLNSTYMLSSYQQRILNNETECALNHDEGVIWGLVRGKNGYVSEYCGCTKLECKYLLTSCRRGETIEDIKKEIEFREQLITKYAVNKLESSRPLELEPTVVQPEPEKLGEPAVEASEETPIKPKETVARQEEQESVVYNSEQGKVIKAAYGARMLVNSGPGTGKTWTLIEKIKYMLQDENVEPESIVVLCFSRAAVSVIVSRLKLAEANNVISSNWHQIDIRTFDSFATYLLGTITSAEDEELNNLLSSDEDYRKYGYEGRIKLSTDVFNKDKERIITSSWQHVIVDEVQDLVGARAEFVLSLANSLPDECGYTMLGDSCQAIYDYLSEQNAEVMDSATFIHKLLQDHPETELVELTHNYRQNDKLAELSLPYRKAILAGNIQKEIDEAANLRDNIAKAAFDIDDLDVEELMKYVEPENDKQVGILTRTNAQALWVSQQLRMKKVKHRLETSKNVNTFAMWIFNVLTKLDTGVMATEESFKKTFAGLYPKQNDQAIAYWRAILSTQKEPIKRSYMVEELLRGLLYRAKDDLLFHEPDEIVSSIIVSNVHRSKGLEFDKVIVLSEILNHDNLERDSHLEHRVEYVALTRAKESIVKVELETKYICTFKDYSRRCYGRNYIKLSGIPYLSNIEVLPEDVNIPSLAVDAERQQWIANELSIGTQIELRKTERGTDDCPIYEVFDCDNRHVICEMNTGFTEAVKKAIEYIYNGRFKNKYFNSNKKFTGIYVTNKTTCISNKPLKLKGAKKYGDIYVWLGVSISGYATRI